MESTEQREIEGDKVPGLPDHRFNARLLGGDYAKRSRSMGRYGIELREALRDQFGTAWQFEEFSVNPSYLARSLEERIGVRASNALTRYVDFPIQASQLKADVFHVLDHSFSQLLLALDPRRSVVTCHDLIPLLISQRVLDLPMESHVGWTFTLRMWFMKRAAYVVAVSESTRRDIVKYLKIDPERVITIASGVSSEFHPPCDPEGTTRLKQQLDIPQDVKVMLTVSGKQAYKNVDAILQALSILKGQSSSKVRFLRVGGDFSVQQNRLIDELQLEDWVQYAGSPQTDKELALLYQMADVFVFPSWYEGFGWPPLEAMKCGTPVVASNAGSLPEVLGDAALFVDPKDARTLADAIGALIRTPSLHAEMVDRGLKKAAEYTWERTARKTFQLYQRVVQEHGRPQEPGRIG